MEAEGTLLEARLRDKMSETLGWREYSTSQVATRSNSKTR